MATIAVIEDDAHISAMLKENLEKAGYTVRQAWSGTEALYLLRGCTVDLVLLDLMLPGLDGEEVLSHIEGIPTIVVSAKVGVDDKVKLLTSGAADYITKPFEIRELLARIEVQLRKGGARQSVLTCGSLTMNLTSREVSVQGAAVRLTRTEYAILHILMENAGCAVSKNALLEGIADETPDCMESSLKVHISNLRRKLREAGGKDCIESVWGIGFCLNAEDTL